MKISEMITALEYSKNTYGDLDVSISMTDVKEEIVLSEDKNIFFAYIQQEKKDIMSLQNYPF